MDTEALDDSQSCRNNIERQVVKMDNDDLEIDST